MDTTDSKIKFDKNGICDHCNIFYEKILPNWDTGQLGEKRLIKLIDKIKKSGEK
jgi:hypothetical protein